MPWTMGAFAVGALAMIGVPPTAGFLSKWYILQGAMQSTNWLAVGIVVASTMLNAAYFLPIIFRAFLKAPAEKNPVWVAAHPEEYAEHGEAPWPMVLALLTTALATVLMFFHPDVPLALAKLIVGE
jgi:multicomponent Na+:H+ antiporter subunit D